MGLLILWAPPEPTLCPWPWLRPPFLSTNPNPNLFFSSNIHLESRGLAYRPAGVGGNTPPNSQRAISSAARVPSLLCCLLVNLDHNTRSQPGPFLLRDVLPLLSSREATPRSPREGCDQVVECFILGLLSEPIWLSHYFLCSVVVLRKRMCSPLPALSPSSFSVLHRTQMGGGATCIQRHCGLDLALHRL